MFSSHRRRDQNPNPPIQRQPPAAESSVQRRPDMTNTPSAQYLFPDTQTIFGQAARMLPDDFPELQDRAGQFIRVLMAHEREHRLGSKLQYAIILIACQLRLFGPTDQMQDLVEACSSDLNVDPTSVTPESRKKIVDRILLRLKGEDERSVRQTIYGEQSNVAGRDIGTINQRPWQ